MVSASVDPLTLVAQMEEQLARLRQQIVTTAESTSSGRLDHGSTDEEHRVAHEGFKADREIWQSLLFAGLQHDGHGSLIELRRCPSCQSTITRPIGPKAAISLCHQQFDLIKRLTRAVTEAAASPIEPNRKAPRRNRGR